MRLNMKKNKELLIKYNEINEKIKTLKLSKEELINLYKEQNKILKEYNNLMLSDKKLLKKLKNN